MSLEPEHVKNSGHYIEIMLGTNAGSIFNWYGVECCRPYPPAGCYVDLQGDGTLSTDDFSKGLSWLLTGSVYTPTLWRGSPQRNTACFFTLRWILSVCYHV